MRTNIVIDDKLMREVLRASGLKTKREAVEEGLRTLLRLKRQGEIRNFRGKLGWMDGGWMLRGRNAARVQWVQARADGGGALG